MAETKIDLDTQTKGTLPPDRGGTGNGSPFTQGSVLFAGASAFDQDNANFFWDNTNKRLSLGTDSPAQMLHVSKAQDGQTLITVNNTGALWYAEAGLQMVSDNGLTYLTRTSGTAGHDSITRLASTVPGEKFELLNLSLTIPAGAAAGYVLTSDANGVGTWQASGGALPTGLTFDGNLFSVVGTGGSPSLQIGPDVGALAVLNVVGTEDDGPQEMLKLGKQGYGSVFFTNSYTDASNWGTTIHGSSGFSPMFKFNVESGRLGLGTDAPAAAFHVEGGSIMIVDGTQQNGYVLTSDANGLASWQPAAGGGGNPYAGSDAFVVTNTYKYNTGSPNYQLDRADAMAYDGTNLWVCSPNSPGLRKLSTSGVVLARYTLPEQPESLTYAFGYVWVVCGTISLYKVDTTTGAVVSTYISGKFMRHVTANSTHLYLSCPNDATIYQFDPVNEVFHNQFDQAEASTPNSIVTDGGTTAWVIDHASSNINRVNRDPVYASLNVFNLTFTAQQEGTAGNNVTVKFEFKGSGLPDVSVTGNDIVITVFNSTSSSRERYVVAAVNSHPQAFALVRAATGSPNSMHNYNQAPYNAPQNLAGGTDHVLGTIDVSASGLPFAGASVNGFLWVTMSNGDLLKIDQASDNVLATFPSGASSLGGLTYDSYFLYMAEASPSNLYVFDFTLEYFVKAIPAGNNIDDVAWDGNNELFAVSRSSAIIRRLNRFDGSLLGTIDVSASGLPRRAVYTNAKLWVTMSNGDLLRVNTASDVVDATYPSGQSQLEGITQGTGSTFYVSDPSTQLVIPFDIGGGTFGTPLDLTTMNVPNDIAWDTGNYLWSLDYTSNTIKRFDTGGNFVADIDVSADGGLPRRLGPTLSYGLWVTMDTGHVLLCDSNGNTPSIARTMDTGNTDLKGIYSINTNDFYLAFSGATDTIERFYYDSSAFHGRVLKTLGMADSASRIKVGAKWFWTLEAASDTLRKVDASTGNTLFTLDTSAYGTPLDLMNVGTNMYLTLDNGDVLSVNMGYEQAAASLVMGDITHTANTTGAAGNTFNVEYTGGNTLGQATVTTWDGVKLIVDIESGVTTADTIVEAIIASTGNGPFLTVVSGTGSNPQVTTAQTFFTGGGDLTTAAIRAIPSGRAALAGISEQSNWSPSGPLVGVSSPSNSYVRFISTGSPSGVGDGFYYSGLVVQGSYPERMYADATDVWVCDTSANNDASFRVNIATMTLAAHITGGAFHSTSYPQHVTGHGGYIYFANWNQPWVHKIDPATNTEILRILVGDQQGGNNYAYCLGLHSTGTSLFVTSVTGGSDDPNVTMDRIVGDRIVSAKILGNANNGSDTNPMVSVGDTLFLYEGYGMHKIKSAG